MGHSADRLSATFGITRQEQARKFFLILTIDSAIDFHLVYVTVIDNELVIIFPHTKIIITILSLTSLCVFYLG